MTIINSDINYCFNTATSWLCKLYMLQVYVVLWQEMLKVNMVLLGTNVREKQRRLRMLPKIHLKNKILIVTTKPQKLGEINYPTTSDQ